MSVICPDCNFPCNAFEIRFLALTVTIRLNVIMYQKDSASKDFTFCEFSSRSNRTDSIKP